MDTKAAIAKEIHYPQCWDTAAYPTLESAILETVCATKFRCSECASAEDEYVIKRLSTALAEVFVTLTGKAELPTKAAEAIKAVTDAASVLKLEVELYRSLAGAASEHGDEWLPIATAPRDGTNILIRFGSDGASQAKYVPGVPHPWKFIDTQDGVTWLINHAVDNEYGPTHWMHIPGKKSAPLETISDTYLAAMAFSGFGIVCDDAEAVGFARFVIALDRQRRSAKPVGAVTVNKPGDSVRGVSFMSLNEYGRTMLPRGTFDLYAVPRLAPKEPT